MPYIAKDIEEYHYNIADDETNPVPVDEGKADAILFCIAREKRKRNDIINQAVEQINKIELWRDSEVERYEREIARQTERLQMYFLSLVAADPDLKTKKLPNGTIKARKQQDELIIEDEKEFMMTHYDNAKETGFVKVTYKTVINKRAVKDYIKETGDLPDGCILNIRDDKFSITTN